MTRLLRDVSLLLLACAGVLVGALPGQTIRPGVSAGGAVETRPSAEYHVALVGAVSSPGAYRVDRSLNYVELIDAAGGPTPDHSPSVLLVRQGRLHTLLYDAGAAERNEFGRLRDGDVVVLRPQPGVRRAVYETTAELDAQGRPRHGVRNAHRDAFVHVACVGLAAYPVVLPLNPHQASQHALLRDMLGMSDESIRTGAKVLTDGGRFVNDGALQDGTVIQFDLRQLGPEAIRPVERFPDPRTLPPLEPRGNGEPVGGSTAIIPAPSPFTAAADVDPISAPFSRAPGSAPSPERSTSEVTTATPTPLLHQPLYVPGLPFECYDEAVEIASTGARSTAASTSLPGGVWSQPAAAPAPVDAAGDRARPVDITERQNTGGRTFAGPPTTTPVRVISVAPTPAAAPRGVRPAAAAPLPTTTGWQSVEIEGDASDAAGELAAVGPAGGIPEAIWRIIVATAMAVGLCSLAAYLWLHAAGRTPSCPMTASADAPQTAAASHVTRRPTELDDLVEHRLPIVEEPPVVETGVRLHGPTIGQRQVYFDPAHARAAGPHFATEAKSGPTAARLARHVAAARRPRVRCGVAAAPAETEAATDELGPERYDVVQPEAGDATSTGRAPHENGSGDVLARALATLREGRG